MSDEIDTAAELSATAERDEAVEATVEGTDPGELQRLADAGDADALAELVRVADEQQDVETLHRLAADGSSEATELLGELESQGADGDDD